MRNLQPLTSQDNALCTNLWTIHLNSLVSDQSAVDDRGCGNVNNRGSENFCQVASLPSRLLKDPGSFQISGRSGSDAGEWSMITYREVVIAAICA